METERRGEEEQLADNLLVDSSGNEPADPQEPIADGLTEKVLVPIPSTHTHALQIQGCIVDQKLCVCVCVW